MRRSSEYLTFSLGVDCVLMCDPSLCRANDNEVAVDMDEDNMSLSSVEDLPVAAEEDKFSSGHSEELDPNLISIEKILLNPGRKRRPRKILVVIRGLPGSGKTHIAKLIKDKEVEMGGSAPRILSIDDYFTTETDEVTTCPATGKDICLKEMVYEFEAEMEAQYLQYLLKAYKKTVSDGYFDFIVVDAVYPKMSSVLEIITHAKSKGFVVSKRERLHLLMGELIHYCLLLIPSRTFARWNGTWPSVWHRTSTIARRRSWQRCRCNGRRVQGGSCGWTFNHCSSGVG